MLLPLRFTIYGFFTLMRLHSIELLLCSNYDTVDITSADRGSFLSNYLAKPTPFSQSLRGFFHFSVCLNCLRC